MGVDNGIIVSANDCASGCRVALLVLINVVVVVLVRAVVVIRVNSVRFSKTYERMKAKKATRPTSKWGA